MKHKGCGRKKRKHRLGVRWKVTVGPDFMSPISTVENWIHWFQCSHHNLLNRGSCKCQSYIFTSESKEETSLSRGGDYVPGWVRMGDSGVAQMRTQLTDSGVRLWVGMLADSFPLSHHLLSAVLRWPSKPAVVETSHTCIYI